MIAMMVQSALIVAIFAGCGSTGASAAAADAAGRWEAVSYTCAAVDENQTIQLGTLSSGSFAAFTANAVYAADDGWIVADGVWVDDAGGIFADCDSRPIRYRVAALFLD
ncbi:MAG: hypothetical protein ABMB14_34580 [Myxococcota bacterium]